MACLNIIMWLPCVCLGEIKFKRCLRAFYSLYSIQSPCMCPISNLIILCTNTKNCNLFLITLSPVSLASVIKICLETREGFQSIGSVLHCVFFFFFTQVRCFNSVTEYIQAHTNSHGHTDGNTKMQCVTFIPIIKQRENGCDKVTKPCRGRGYVNSVQLELPYLLLFKCCLNQTS